MPTNNAAPELTWPENIIADRHEVTGLWVIHYATDEQAQVFATSMKPQPDERDEVIRELVEALQQARNRVENLSSLCSSRHWDTDYEINIPRYETALTRARELIKRNGGV